MGAGGGHPFELVASRHKNNSIIYVEVLIDPRVDEGQVGSKHAEIIVFVHLAVVVDQEDGQNYNHQQEDHSHDPYVILLLDQKLREGNSHVERASPVRISILQTFFFGFLISQTLIGLGNDDKFSTGLGVIRIPIGVIQKCQLAISLLDLFNGCIILNLKNLVGVKSFNLVLSL